jgi:hypothetical protein
MSLDNLSSPDISSDTIEQLPPELAEMILAQQIKNKVIVDALQVEILKQREAAKKARAACGIENEWAEDNDQYEGVDDANRGTHNLVKPNHPSGVVTNHRTGGKNKSTVFMNITRQYVDSAAASVSEMGNPTNDRNFELKPIPIPEMEAHKDDQTPHPSVDAKTGQPVNATVADHVAQAYAQSKTKAEAAQKRIDDWLIQCQWHAHQRRAIHAAAKVGTGVMKGPYPNVVKKKTTIKGPGGKVGLEMSIETQPASKCIPVERCYPDLSVGEDIQQGAYHFELDFTNAVGVRDMKELDGYIAQQIDAVLEAGPKPTGGSGNQVQIGNDQSDKYEIWYYYGQLTREEIKAMGITESLNPDDETDKKALGKIEELEACPCIVTLVNDIVVKASLNPLDSGEYPYDYVTWEKREGLPFGRGISRIIRDAQRIVNAGIRNLMDNAALSGGVQVGFKKGAIKPLGNGDWKLDRITFWEMQDDDARTINDVLSFHQIPSLQEELMNIIQFGQKMAEDVSGMPLLLQGQSGSAPDTVGGMQLLNKNATATRRMVARQIDDDLTEPHIRRYYTWILMYGEEEEKGDFTIDARGSQALVERDIQREFSIQMIDKTADPKFGIDPYKAMGCVLRAEMIDPATWQYTEEQFKAIQAQQSQTASAPAVQAAQIRVASAEKIEAAKEVSEKEIAQIRADGDMRAVQARTARDDAAMKAQLEADHNLRLEELQIEREIAIMKYASDQKINLQNAKAQLAQTSMKLGVEKQLNDTANAMELATAHQDTLAHHTDIAHEAATQQVQNDQTSSDTNQQQAHEQAMQDTAHRHAKEIETMKHGHAKALAKISVNQQPMSANRSPDQGRAQLLPLQHKHNKEMENLKHKHAMEIAKLKPAVQVPGRSAKGQSLSQAKPVKK